MKNLIEIFKLLTDRQRVRILMLLDKKELCVCQLMGIIGSTQSLISRNLSLLYRAGLLEERREGKLRYYRISRDLSGERKAVISLLRNLLKSDTTLERDIETLQECAAFQRMTGKCDMKTLKEFMKRKEGGSK